MGFISLLSLLLLILIPVVILLYLLKQKAEDFTVPSLLLWQEAYKNIEASAPWEKLKKNLLLFLQLLILLAIIFAMASPYLKKGGNGYGQVLMAIDTSGSMNMAYNDSESRFSEAIKQAEHYLDGLREGTAVTILSVNTNVVIHGTSITNKEEAKRILSQIKTTDLSGELNNSISLISSMVAQWDSYEVLFFTDQWVDFQEMNGRIVDVNSMVVNGVVEYINYAETENGLTVLVKVSNPSPYLLESDINLYLDGQLRDISQVKLAAGESQVLYFEGVSGDGRLLMAELNERDGLAQDNQAYVVIENDEEGEILLVSERNLFLERGISSLAGVTLYKTNHPDNIGPEDVFDLYIFDGLVPETLPTQGNVIFLGVEADYGDFIKVTETYQNTYLTTASHEVTRYLEAFTFGVTTAYGYERPLWARNIFLRDEQSVGFVGESEGRMIAVVGFDFHHSDFALQIEFPIFIHNLINHSLKRGLVSGNKYAVGARVDLNPNPSGSDITIKTPFNEEMVLPLKDFTGIYEELDYAGPYLLSQRVGEDVVEALIIAEFPTDTESVVKSNEGQMEGVLMVNPEGLRGGRELRTLLIGLAFVLLLGEWIVYLKEL